MLHLELIKDRIIFCLHGNLPIKPSNFPLFDLLVLAWQYEYELHVITTLLIPSIYYLFFYISQICTYIYKYIYIYKYV